jgi:hypothetical protein
MVGHKLGSRRVSDFVGGRTTTRSTTGVAAGFVPDEMTLSECGVATVGGRLTLNFRLAYASAAFLFPRCSLTSAPCSVFVFCVCSYRDEHGESALSERSELFDSLSLPGIVQRRRNRIVRAAVIDAGEAVGCCPLHRSLLRVIADYCCSSTARLVTVNIRPLASRRLRNLELFSVAFHDSLVSCACVHTVYMFMRGCWVV